MNVGHARRELALATVHRHIADAQWLIAWKVCLCVNMAAGGQYTGERRFGIHGFHGLQVVIK